MCAKRSSGAKNRKKNLEKSILNQLRLNQEL